MYTDKVLEAYQALANRQYGDELRMYDKMRQDNPDKKYELIESPEEKQLVQNFNRVIKESYKPTIDIRPPLVDIIILAYSKTQEYYDMTCETIRSLKSCTHVPMRILVVETNQNIFHENFDFPLFESAWVRVPREEFAYNRFLTLGYHYLQDFPSPSPYLLVLNNDITAFCPAFVTRLLDPLDQYDASFGLDIRDSWRLGLETSQELLPNYHYNRYFGWGWMVKKTLFDHVPFEEFFPKDILFYNQDVYFVKMLEHLKLKHVNVPHARVWHKQHTSHVLRSKLIRETCEHAEFSGGQLKHLEISPSDHAPHQVANDPGITFTPALKQLLGD